MNINDRGYRGVSDLEQLVAGCLVNPTDAAPRLILSDYLQENGADEFELLLMRSDGKWMIDDIKKRKVVWQVESDQLPRKKSRVRTIHEDEPTRYEVMFLSAVIPKCNSHQEYARGFASRGKWLCETCRMNSQRRRPPELPNGLPYRPMMVSMG